MSGPKRHPDENQSSPPDLLTPGGKVDPDALRAFYDAADDEDRAVVAFTLQRDHNTRLDKYLTSRVTHLSRSQLQKLIDDGAAVVNGRVAKASTKLRESDTIELTLPPPHSGRIEGEQIPLRVLFEDEHLIVLNKQADIIVHPARSENSGTMLNALVWHFAHKSESGGDLSDVGVEHARPGVVHRLDRNTSGCIVFAKSDEAHWKLGQQFEHRRVDKRYLAVVQGAVTPGVRTIDDPIGPHPSRLKGLREKQVVRRDDLGKPSLTICRVRERYRLHERPVADQQFTLVELELKTGRTHQIRVHMSHIGHALVGDDMYKGRPFVEHGQGGKTLIDTPALHAALLAFEHPITGEGLVFTTPPRDEIVRLIERLREAETASVHAEGSVPLARFGL